MTDSSTKRGKYSFTMKNMKGVKENLGTPLSVAAFLISPFRRPTPRRWITPGEPPVASKGNNFLFAGETLTVQGSPLHPSSKTFFDG